MGQGATTLIGDGPVLLASEAGKGELFGPNVTASAEAAVVSTKHLRRSKRAAAVADMHTLHKVEMMAAKRNLESSGISFSSFSDSQVISNLGRCHTRI